MSPRSLGGGRNEHGSVLRLSTLATMFEPHYRPHPAVPGMGLGFFRHDVGGHRVVGHEGILPGFNSGILVAPDDGVGVFALTNGSRRAMVWLPTELAGLLHHLLDVPTGDEAGQRSPAMPGSGTPCAGATGFPRSAICADGS